MRTGNVWPKCKIVLTGLSCALGMMSLAGGAIPVEGQSAEQVASHPPEEIPSRTVPVGNAGHAPTSSWNKPVFMGNPKNMGSPYVPLDSWIYPAFDRLIALGYIRSAIIGQRPSPHRPWPLLRAEVRGVSATNYLESLERVHVCS